MAVQASRPRRRGREQPTPRQLLRAGGIALCICAVLTLVLTLHLLPRPFEFREGDVATESIRSPRQLRYVSQILTRAERERAMSAVPDVYYFDAQGALRQRNQLTAALQKIAAVRASSQPADAKREGVRGAADPPLSDEVASGIVALEDSRWVAVSAEAQRLLGDAMRERISDATLPETQRSLAVRVSDQLGEGERLMAVELASRFLRPTLVLDTAETARQRQKAADEVEPVYVTVERNEMVLREGDVVRPLDVEKLEALGLRNPVVDWRGVLAGGLLVLVAVGVIAWYCYVLEPHIITRDRRLLLIALLMFVTVLAAKLVLPDRPLWTYLFPLSAVAMLLTTLLSVNLAILICSLLAVLLAYGVSGSGDYGPASLEWVVISVASSAVAAVAVHRKERLYSYFLGGGLAAVAEFLVVLAFQILSRSEDWRQLALLGFLSLVNGIGAAILAVGTFSLLGRLFDITTAMQLLELANPSQPLLRELLRRAPGTYYHSLMVGNLAESAAEAIGADPLVVRVGALYHDIGKLQRPHFFIENQVDGQNVHDALDPQTSARIIAAHVTDGLELAERYHLPARIRDLIPQHHGTRLVTYFYRRAAEQGDGELDVTAFSYPGPKPQTKEAALLMFADSVEAAVRASKDHSPEAIARLVDRIVMDQLAEGQLNECDLSLEDIQEIKRSFIASLQAIYHPRIEYPSVASRGAHG